MNETTATAETTQSNLVGVRGWLAFFLLTLMVFSPLMDLAYLGKHPDQISNPLVWILIFGLHGFGIYAGILMLMGKAKGVKLAKVRLIVGLCIAALGLVGSIIGAKGNPDGVGDAIMSGIRSMAYASVWLGYLSESKRVRATYFPTAPEFVEPVKTA